MRFWQPRRWVGNIPRKQSCGKARSLRQGSLSERVCRICGLSLIHIYSFDGHLLVTAVQDSDGQAVSCAFDPISKSLQKLTLTSDDEKSVLILAEGSEYFLVRYGLMEYEVPDYAPDGREITTTMLLPNLRLIAKSDYWNNIPNYILLDDYVYSRKP